MRVPIFTIPIALVMAFANVNAQSREENWKVCTNKDPDRSITACSALIQSGQESVKNAAIAFDNRGMAYARKHDFDHALRDYDQSLQLNPDSAAAHYNRGIVYEFKHDYGRAFPDLDRAVQLDPGDADALYCRGLAFEHREDYERAIQDFNQALRVNPKYAKAFYSRAVSFWHTGSYLRAAADYGRWRRSGPVTLEQLCVLIVVLSFMVGYVRRSLQRSRPGSEEQSSLTSLFRKETTTAHVANPFD